MYRVIEQFADLQDDKYVYELGMIYPRKGYTPTEDRMKELSGTDNKIGKPVIQYFDDPVKTDEKPKNNKKQKK